MTKFKTPTVNKDSLLSREIQRFTRDLILKTLREHDGNRSTTARALGIARRTVFNYCRRYPELAVPPTKGVMKGAKKL